MNGHAIDLNQYVDKIVGSGALRKVDRARAVSDGSQHLVVIIDEAVVARFPRNDSARAQLAAEANLLNQLVGQITVPLPVPFYVHADFTLHRLLHGAMTTRSAIACLAPLRQGRFLDNVAQFLTELRAAVAEHASPSPATTSPDRLAKLRARAHEHLVPWMMQHQRDWLDELFSDAEQAGSDVAPCIVHGDLAPYHILHYPDTGALTGVIDFGVAGLGDPAVDLACLLATWGERYCVGLMEHARGLADRARLLASLLPVEWAVLAREHASPDLAIAHLGHLATDVYPASAHRASRQGYP